MGCEMFQAKQLPEMKITPYDQLTRYMVQSDVNPDNEYLVDLDQYGGVGWCDCPHFKYRLEPQLCTPEGRAASKKRPMDFRCKHLMEARKQLGEDLVNTLTKQNIQKTKALKAQMNSPKRIGKI